MFDIYAVLVYNFSMKRCTIKDVAREAGVSVATVSYVINNKEGQKITPATKKKVLQIINLLNYTPNSSAQNLSNNRNSYIALHYPVIQNSFQSLDVPFFIEKLSQVLLQEKYNLVYIPCESNTPINQVAGIICFNEPIESFLDISESNLTPIIAVDCIVDNPLFYQLNLDYPTLRKKADNFFNGEEATLVCINFNSEQLKETIKKSFNSIVYLDSYEDLRRFQSSNTKNIVLINPSIYDLIDSEQTGKIFFHSMYEEEKFSFIADLLKNAIDRAENKNHNVIYF